MENPPVKKTRNWSKVLAMVGLLLVILGVIQAFTMPNTLNFLIFPGALLMLLAVVMPEKKKPIAVNPKPAITEEKK